MIHLFADPSAGGKLLVMATGRGVRVPDAWDRSVTFDDLVAKGLVQIDALEPLLRKGLRGAVDERLQGYPQFADAIAVVIAVPDGGIPLPAGSSLPHLRPRDVTSGFVISGSATTRKLLLEAFTDEGFNGLRVRDPFTLFHHEAAHALDAQLLKIPGIDGMVAEVVSAALHRDPPHSSLAQLTLEDRLAIADQIGSYGATGAYDVQGAAVGLDEHGVAGEASWWSILNELCAEACARDAPENRRDLPIVRGIGELMDAVLGRSSPVAKLLNDDAHRSLAVVSYVERTRPAALDELLVPFSSRWEPDQARDALERERVSALQTDPDFRWELQNPHEPPAWMLDELVEVTGSDRAASRAALMYAGKSVLRGCTHGAQVPQGLCTGPASGGAGARSCAWHEATSTLLQRSPMVLSPAVAAAVAREVRGIVDRICAELRAAPLPDVSHSVHRVTHDRRIAAPRWTQQRALERLEQLRGAPDVGGIGRLPGWSEAEKGALRNELEQGIAAFRGRSVAPVDLDEGNGAAQRGNGVSGSARSARRVRRTGTAASSSPSVREDAGPRAEATHPVDRSATAPARAGEGVRAKGRGSLNP